MVSWLPLYHDMGLVGFLAIPMTTGVDLVLAGPQDFLAHPAHWMEWISEWHGTATAGPNFSWVLATRALRRASRLDLSSLTLALSGAEPVDPDAVDAFVAAAEPHGFRAGRCSRRSGWPRWRSPGRSRRAAEGWSATRSIGSCSSVIGSPSRWLSTTRTTTPSGSGDFPCSAAPFPGWRFASSTRTPSRSARSATSAS